MLSFYFPQFLKRQSNKQVNQGYVPGKDETILGWQRHLWSSWVTWEVWPAWISLPAESLL